MKHDANLLHLRDLYADISRSHHAAVFPSLSHTRVGRSYPWWTCVLAAIFHLSTDPSDIDSSTLQRMKRALKRHYRPTRSAGDHTVRLLATDLSMQHAAQLRLEDMEEGRKPGNGLSQGSSRTRSHRAPRPLLLPASRGRPAGDRHDGLRRSCGASRQAGRSGRRYVQEVVVAASLPH